MNLIYFVVQIPIAKQSSLIRKHVLRMLNSLLQSSASVSAVQGNFLSKNEHCRELVMISKYVFASYSEYGISCSPVGE